MKDEFRTKLRNPEDAYRAVIIKNVVFWVLTPNISVGAGCKYACVLPDICLAYFSTPKMQTPYPSEK
jgi:hypothetical protein